MIEVAVVIKKSKQAAGFIAVCILLLPICCALFACVPIGKDSRPLLWYSTCTFPFEMTLPSSNDGSSTIHLQGKRTPDSVSLTVVSPEGIKGLTVLYQRGNCTLSAGESTIPLSKKGAEGLTCLLDALLLSSAENAKLGSAEDGKTTLTFDTLTLTLDENGLPAEILQLNTGRKATLSVLPETVIDPKSSDENNKDRKNNEHQTENNSGDLGIRADP